jgi:nucleoside-diphosphate-sugar epimerase
MKKILGLKKVKIVHTPKREGDVRRTFANVTQARKLLGYLPGVPFKEGLRRTVHWFLKNAHRL